MDFDTFDIFGSDQAEFVHEFFRVSKQLCLSPNGDFPTDTVVSTAAVILAAAVAAQRSAEYVSSLTLLPIEFVQVVLNYADEIALWEQESFVDVLRILAESPEDFMMLEDRVAWAVDDLWEADAVDDVLLHVYRGAVVLGGTERQYRWEDEVENLLTRMQRRLEKTWNLTNAN